jgi:hypothetical protein
VSARKLRIERVDLITITKSWAKSSISFQQYENGEIDREVRVAVDSPSMLSYVRERLDEIEKYWKDSIG